MARLDASFLSRACKACTAHNYHTIQKAKVSTKAKIHNRASEDTLAQRDLFVDILSTNATKRDAKQFLARLKDHDIAKQKPSDAQQPAVNLGTLYGQTSAIANTPQFVRDHNAVEVVESGERHVALVSLRGARDLNDETIDGLATTISQLVKLDMHILLVLAHDGTSSDDISAVRVTVAEQASRLARAIDNHCPQGARIVMDALKVSSDAGLQLVSPRLVFDPLDQGVVTIVPTLAYTAHWKTKTAALSDVILALIDTIQQRSSAVPAMTLDRVILLDPLGGIPSRVRDDNAHVFINLEQEYADIEAELDTMRSTVSGVDTHIENLRILGNALATLPHSTSALIVSPQEAAASSVRSQDTTHAIGAGTRKQRNTLIHNLLTNKPLVSSSLPVARFASAADEQPLSSKAPNATLVKKGMRLSIIPNIEHGFSGWQRPNNGITSLDLQNDPRIDLPRLVHLINNSFRRELDVRRYLERIKGRVAGLIIAGNYEGGAILTWETPAGHDAADPSHLVPYLDKFAVLQSSQGSAGVADIVFQAMVRSCFPQGVCWRSRSNNPVNKWYFERAAGSWTLPDTQWTMFWTGGDVVNNRERWKDYVAVCEGIVPTWADNKVPD
ncbi:hypothetical protein AMS68_006764 [Peltaster fructicola]|uniref:Amino-acid acetyltransferase, mitochondrial n=1 Tax=Peltaster fructicola TaxID=286661 RepID=A0A6H0Y2L9_9PEZI|nr:hypothetical protein AMS68_006764 [Peltaster fructicola]